MRTFEEFPEKDKCPCCGTNDPSECVLIPIQGTEDGGNVECIPMHTGCLATRAAEFMYVRIGQGMLCLHAKGDEG